MGKIAQPLGFMLKCIEICTHTKNNGLYMQMYETRASAEPLLSVSPYVTLNAYVVYSKDDVWKYSC